MKKPVSLFSSLRHLLPRTPAWDLIAEKPLRWLFESIGARLDLVRTYYDQIWLDAFPDTTRELNAWDAVQGTPNYYLTTAERRERFAGWLTAMGGQSPRYIQDVLQAAGYPVYVHDWWADSVPTARDPHILGGVLLGAGDPQMEAGEPMAEAGNFLEGIGYVLANKLYFAEPNYLTGAGEPLMEAGEPIAEAGNYDGVNFVRIGVQIPDDPDTWPYFMYLGGSTYGDVVYIPESRREDFEDLVLAICPEHLWIGLFVKYTTGNIVDNSLNYVVDNSGNRLVAEV